MEPNTLRLPANTWEDLSTEAEEYDFRNRSEYVRHLIENRDVIVENTETSTTDYEELRKRVEKLESKVDDQPLTPTPQGSETPFQDIDFPSTREHDECVPAIEAAAEYIRENGGASMRDLVRDVMPDHPIGYEVPELEEGERYRGAWWRQIVRPGLEAHPNIKKPPSGGSRWRWSDA